MACLIYWFQEKLEMFCLEEQVMVGSLSAMSLQICQRLPLFPWVRNLSLIAQYWLG